jgi:glycosyltransferase involved in cell wall biosynthesis
LRQYAARLQLGLSQNEICVGSAAYFTKEKNLEYLVKCADHFSKINHSIKFALIGPVEKSMENVLKRNTSIISTGSINNAVSLYNAFDVYLSTSRSEGLGSALLDAIVRDIPSVALDAGGNRDLFGTFGSPAKDYTELLEQLSAIFADYCSAQARAAAHGAWARTLFSRDNFMSRHCELYEKLL